MANSTTLQKQNEQTDLEQNNKFMSRVTYTPRVDILETDDELTLFLDMPGVKPEDVNLRFDKGELTILGRVQPRQEETSYVMCEYGVGDFQRTFNVSQEVDTDKISAEVKNGVLKVHLPKAEKAKPRRILVRGE